MKPIQTNTSLYQPSNISAQYYTNIVNRGILPAYLHNTGIQGYRDTSSLPACTIGQNTMKESSSSVSTISVSNSTQSSFLPKFSFVSTIIVIGPY